MDGMRDNDERHNQWRHFVFFLCVYLQAVKYPIGRGPGYEEKWTGVFTPVKSEI